MGQYRRSLGDFNAFKALSPSEKLEQTVELVLSDDNQYKFFIDNPRHQPAPRLNIVGHGDKGGQIFQGDMPGACLLTPAQHHWMSSLSDNQNRGPVYSLNQLSGWCH